MARLQEWTSNWHDSLWQFRSVPWEYKGTGIPTSRSTASGFGGAPGRFISCIKPSIEGTALLPQTAWRSPHAFGRPHIWTNFLAELEAGIQSRSSTSSKRSKTSSRSCQRPSLNESKEHEEHEEAPNSCKSPPLILGSTAKRFSDVSFTDPAEPSLKVLLRRLAAKNTNDLPQEDGPGSKDEMHQTSSQNSS